MYTPEQYGIFLLWNISVLFFIFLGCQSVRDRIAQAGAHQY